MASHYKRPNGTSGEVNHRSVHFANRLQRGRTKETNIHADAMGSAIEFLNAVPVLLWKTDSNGLYTYFNRTWLEFRGRKLEQEKGFGWIEGIHPEDLNQALKIQSEATEFKRVFVRYFRLLGSDQKYHWMKDSGAPLFHKGGTFLGYAGSSMNWTEDHQEKELLQKSLEQTETLVRESHHRMKNHLQILSGLFALQSENLSNHTVMQILKNCQNRVRIISLLQHKLFENPFLDGLDFSEYVHELSQMILDSYENGGQKILLDIDVESVKLDPDRIIPCGLILNELITNSFKYAFPHQEGGRIGIRFYSKNQHHILEISDTGIGLSEEIEISHATTLGLKLVSILTKQLGGEIQISRNTGTKVLISFPR
jgi:PAS domain S-box-containing protein